MYRMDEDEWMEPYAVPVDDDEWGEGGSGGSTPGKGAGEEAEADRAVEHYWEERGRSPSRSPSVATVVREADVLGGDGAGTEDAGMGELEAEELEDEEDRPKSWSEELRAKKRRTDGDKRMEELQKVRDLGRVRQAAFDKKK